MAKFQLPPAPLAAIAPFIKVSNEFVQRDIVVAYWARLQGLQAGLKIPRTPETQKYLLEIMDWLETTKKEHKENQAIGNDLVAQAHLESKALQLFNWADKEDRASKFGMPTVKAFYTASYLFDVLSTFGELNEKLSELRKYAKWKAAYLFRAQKEGITPIPGPAAMEGFTAENEGDDNDDDINALLSTGPPAAPRQDAPPQMPPPDDFQAPVPAPRTNVDSAPQIPSTTLPPTASGGLTTSDYIEAQKYCKYANSALQYEDAPTAIENLRKALQLLEAGMRS